MNENKKIVTVREVVESATSLQYLANMPLPVKVSYRISLLLNRVEEVIESYNEAIKGAGGNKPNEEEIEELLNSDSGITESVCTINLNDLGDKEIPPVVLSKLSWAVNS